MITAGIYRSLRAFALMAVALPAWGAFVIGTDVEIEDFTPAVVFDDTSVADGDPEWFMSGQDSSFTIWRIFPNNRWLSLHHLDDSIAIGKSALALANDTIAIGAEARSDAENAIAMGYLANASGLNAVAIGGQAEASGEDSVAFGALAQATAVNTTALGTDSEASGSAGSALGPFTIAQGDRSTAIGYRAEAYATGSTAIGPHSLADQPWTIVLGNIPRQFTPDNYHSVGIGTSAPVSPLHIYREDETQEFLMLESAEPGLPQDRAMMYLENNGGIRFEFRDTSKAAGWRFQAQTGQEDRFEITKVGTGEIEYSFRPNGNLYVAGNVFTNSDVNAKQDIVPVDGSKILTRLAALPISEWSYKDAPDQRHMGPMAQDFYAAFGLGEGETTLTASDLAGVSLAAARELHARNQALEASNQRLRERDQQLQARIESLKQLAAHVETLISPN